MANVQQGFTKVPNEATLALASRPNLLALYIRLLAYSELSKNKHQTPWAFVGHETLARELGCSTKSVGRWADELEELGWVTIKKRRGGVVNRHLPHEQPVSSTIDQFESDITESYRTRESGSSEQEPAESGAYRTGESGSSGTYRTGESGTTGHGSPMSKTEGSKTEGSSSKTKNSDAGASQKAGGLESPDKDNDLQPSLSGTSLSIEHQQQVSLSAAASSTVPPPAAPSAGQDVDADRAHSTPENSGGTGWVIAAVESKKYLEANLEPRYRVAARNKADELAVTGRYTAEQIIETVLAELGLKGALV